MRKHNDDIDAGIAEMVDNVADTGNQFLVNRVDINIGKQFSHIRIRALRGNPRARTYRRCAGLARRRNGGFRGRGRLRQIKRRKLVVGNAHDAIGMAALHDDAAILVLLQIVHVEPEDGRLLRLVDLLRFVHRHRVARTIRSRARRRGRCARRFRSLRRARNALLGFGIEAQSHFHEAFDRLLVRFALRARRAPFGVFVRFNAFARARRFVGAQRVVARQRRRGRR